MISRRNFIKSGAGLAAASAFPLFSEPEPSKSKVAVSKGDPKTCVRKCLVALGGIGKFVKPGARVVLKPNMGFPNSPEWGTTTHPMVVQAVAELCVEAGAHRIIVLENPLRDPRMCREKSGIEAAVKGIPNLTVATPKEAKFYQETLLSGALELKSTAIAIEALKADCLINIPNAKSHSATGVSLGIKNLMGLVYDRQVFHEKMELNRAIAEQLLGIRPALTIVSAIYALVTNGPGGPGKVKPLKTVVASEDPVAADAYTVGLTPWYGRSFRGDQIKHLKIASEMGLGRIDPAHMEILQV
jgi:uncharacterized protein (DUF362 family)